MVQDDGFPVYGNVTSIDQVERIQEYVDNKIMDLLNWVLTSLDIIVRGHTLVIGNIGQQVGKNIKQQQRRIQRVIDKHEKTVEVAVGMGYVYPSIDGEFPTDNPRPDDPVIIDEDFPVGNDGLPDEPPVLPPSQPPVQPPQAPGTDLEYPGFPPITPPGIPSPPQPPLPPSQPPTQPPTLPPIVIKPQETCDWGSSSQITSGIQPIPPGNNRGVIIYGGQLNSCDTISEYRDKAYNQLVGIHGSSSVFAGLHYSQIPVPYDFRGWEAGEDLPPTHQQVLSSSVPWIQTAGSTPFEEVGQALIRSHKRDSSGTLRSSGGNIMPEWMYYDRYVKKPYQQIDELAFLDSINPNIKA